MASRHLSRGDIARLIAQQLEQTERDEVGDHLDACAFCRERVRRLSPTTAAGTEPQAVSDTAKAARTYEDAFRRASQVLSTRARAAEQDQRLAPDRLATLLTLPAAARFDRIRESTEFHSRALVEQVFVHCRNAWMDSPDDAERLAELALAIVDRLDSTYFGAPHLFDLKARSWAIIVNTRRIRADLRGAELAAQTALDLLGRGTGDPLTRAEVHNLLASLRRDQRRLEEAASFLNLAIGGYRRGGSPHLVARAMLKRAHLEADMERPAKALALLNRLTRYLDVELEPRLLLSVLETRVVLLHKLGRTEEASSLLPSLRDVAERVGTERERTYVFWVEGLIALSSGQELEAERFFLLARDRFAGAGIGFDSALVSLDLAMLYFRQGRQAETRSLALSMVPIFQAIDIQREAFAALMIFRQAVEAETVTLGMIEGIASYLKGLRIAPAVLYEKPS